MTNLLSRSAAACAGGRYAVRPWLMIALPAAGCRDPAAGRPPYRQAGATCSASRCRWRPSSSASPSSSQMLGLPGDGRSAAWSHLYQWVIRGSFKADMGLLIDPLSISFVLLITGVGSLIHIYSIGYMAHDPDRRRFFAYLNLFVAAMLLLVLADNYLALFIGWEGVGLASYLLIGFWQHKPSRGDRGQEGVHRQPGRRLRPADRASSCSADVRLGRLRRGLRRTPAEASQRHDRPRSACCSCSAPAASRRSSRCSPGCWTRWRARPRSRP